MPRMNSEQAKELSLRRWGGYKFEERFDWKGIQDEYDKGDLYEFEILKKFKISQTSLNKGIKSGLVTKVKKKLIHSKEYRQKMSIQRKQFLKDNPDKCHWRSLDKFKSVPCEKVKEFLRELNILFIEEYQPEIEGRSFSLDIALPEKMIALEINGQQHYLPDGNLKPYYQERHDLLVSCGWNVFEIHYSSCFNLNKWAEFAETLKNGAAVKEFNYFTYKPRKKKCKWKNECNCGGLKTASSKMCAKCRELNIGYKDWPSYKELSQLVWSKPMRDVAKDLFVSDVAVKKRCVKLGIVTPPQGHWIKKVPLEGYDPPT